MLSKPKTDYLFALSTPHGLMQHTMYNLPDPDHGYATDDNARALVVAHLWKKKDQKQKLPLRNVETAFLRFLKFAQLPDGQFYCYVTYDLQKLQPGCGDWYGRSLFALAFMAASSDRFEQVARDMFMRSIGLIYSNQFSLHTHSFIILALYYALQQHAKNTLFNKRESADIMGYLNQTAQLFYTSYSTHESKHWAWPEDTIRYDNGKIIQGYLILGELLGDAKLTAIGHTMLDFYVDQTCSKGYFQAPGNKGYWRKGVKKPHFDEQAIEAYSLTAALVSGARLLKKPALLTDARRVYRWFWGKNRLGLSLVNPENGAVYDGLRRTSLNTNQGAEGYLALNLAWFALNEMIHI